MSADPLEPRRRLNELLSEWCDTARLALEDNIPDAEEHLRLVSGREEVAGDIREAIADALRLETADCSAEQRVTLEQLGQQTAALQAEAARLDRIWAEKLAANLSRISDELSRCRQSRRTGQAYKTGHDVSASPRYVDQSL